MGSTSNDALLFDLENQTINKESKTLAPPSSLLPKNVAAFDQEKEEVCLTVSEILGFDELFSPEAWRAGLGEMMVSTSFVFLVDSIIISTVNSGIQIPNLVLSVLIGITATVLLLAVAPASGANISPVFSFVAGLLGLISMTRAMIYIIGQTIGAFLAVLAVAALITPETNHAFSLGGCTVTIVTTDPKGQTVSAGLSIGQAFLMEFLCTFIFLFGSVWMAFDLRQVREMGRLTVFTIIGILLAILVFVSASMTGQKGYSGAAMNPAKCFATAVVKGGHLWHGHWLFWVAPIVASLAFYVYTKLIPQQHVVITSYKHDIANVFKVVFG